MIFPLRLNAADSVASIFGFSVAITPFAPTILGNDIASVLFATPSTVEIVNIRCSSFAIQRTKSATAFFVSIEEKMREKL